MENFNYLKKSIGITLIFLLSFLTAYPGPIILSTKSITGSNDFTTIEGKVIDSYTNEPLVFVTITAVGTNVGTVTNTEGEFSLNIDNDLNVTQISFKFLGYKNKVVSLGSLKGENIVIKLEAYAVPIGEVVVRPNNPVELIQEILRKIPENYSTEANKLMAFYRETIMNKRKYVSISEAVVEVYKAPYDQNSKDDLVKLYKGRKSANVKAQDTVVMKLKGGPSTALLLDIAKNPDMLFSKDELKNYTFEIDEVVNINNKQNYIIKFNQIPDQEFPLFNGKLYVDIQSYAITAAEFSLNLENEEEAAKMFVSKKPLFMKIIPTATKYYVKYTEDNGKYYFAHARGEVAFKCNWKRKLFNTRYSIMTEIATTDRTTKNVVKFPREEQLRSSIVFEEKVYPFADPDFWGMYNTIKPEESIESTIQKYGVRLKIQEN